MKWIAMLYDFMFYQMDLSGEAFQVQQYICFLKYSGLAAWQNVTGTGAPPWPADREVGHATRKNQKVLPRYASQKTFCSRDYWKKKPDTRMTTTLAPWCPFYGPRQSQIQNLYFTFHQGLQPLFINTLKPSQGFQEDFRKALNSGAYQQRVLESSTLTLEIHTTLTVWPLEI